MFLSVQTLKGEQGIPGDAVVIKYDGRFGKIGAFGIDGKIVGYLADAQPDGCVDAYALYARIEDCRVLAKIAVVLGETLILTSDSPILGAATQYRRIEREGYALLSAK